MEILYVVSQDPISPNWRGGASAVHFDHLAALAELECGLHLWHFAYPSNRVAFDAFVDRDRRTWDAVKAMCRSVEMTTVTPEASFVTRLGSRLTDFVRHERVVNPVHRQLAASELRSLIRRHKPDAIWAQHFGPAQVAVLQQDVPVVWSHHDWLHRIKALRAKRAENLDMKQAEERVARQAAQIVAGSAIERDELKRLGCAQVHYIPVTYPPVAWDAQASADAEPRLIHLGGLQTTATREGLERFFDAAWPRLARPDRLRVIGDVTGASPRLSALLGQVDCTGFVEDLSSVLKPFDVHVIPWEHSTGQRTRAPLALNHGQVLVAIRAAVACYPELEDGKNCRLVDRVEDMAAVINELMADRDERDRLGRAARATFERCFTHEAVLPRYQTVLDSLGARAARAS